MGKLNGCIFFIEDDALWEKYKNLWSKFNHDIKREFDRKPDGNNSFFFLKKKT